MTNSSTLLVEPTRPAQKNATRAKRRIPSTSLEWAEYFRRNATSVRPVPWHLGADASPEEIEPIARSLQAWQLGETSDGRRLRAAAARHGEIIGDPQYQDAIECFIREEQCHGEVLGRFLDLAGVARIRADWGDHLFRAARYCLRNMEVWTTPVVMVETIAVVYYNAIRRATSSRVLRTICSQILADEVPHLRFQCERLAMIFRGRGWLGLWLTLAIQRVAFLAVVCLVWFGHRQALRAGGYTWGHYWRACWDRMNRAWRAMDPAGFDWDRDHCGGVPLEKGHSPRPPLAPR